MSIKKSAAKKPEPEIPQEQAIAPEPEATESPTLSLEYLHQEIESLKLAVSDLQETIRLNIYFVLLTFLLTNFSPLKMTKWY